MIAYAIPILVLVGFVAWPLWLPRLMDSMLGPRERGGFVSLPNTAFYCAYCGAPSDMPPAGPCPDHPVL